MAWIGALAGAYFSAQGAKDANKASAGAGGVNLTSANDPWYPSSGFRTDAMMRAYDQLNNLQAPPAQGNRYPLGPTPIEWQTANKPPINPNGPNAPGPGQGGGGTGGGGGGTGGPVHGAAASSAAPNPPAQGGGKWRAKNPSAPAPKPPGGGKPGPGGVPEAAFNGQSQQTTQIQNQLIANAQKGNPLYGQAEQYVGDTLSGDPSRDRNFYRQETADYLRQEDPDLARYKALLFGSDTGLQSETQQQGGNSGGTVRTSDLWTGNPVGGTGGWGGQGGSGGGGGGGGADMASGPVGADKTLRDLLAGGDAPGAQAMRDRIRRQGEEAYAEQAKALRLRSVGSGMYGGTPYQQAESEALSDFGTGVTDAFAANDYALYGQALGLGTSYDIAALDRAAAERSSRNSASASASAQAADLASRERMQRLDALGGAVGMGLNQNQFRASGFGSLGEGYSSDQQFSLGQMGNVTGLGLRDWGAAGEFSLGADAGRNKFISDAAQARNAGSAINLDRQRLGFDQYRYGREAPLSDIARYTDILNGASGAYGSRTDMGFDKRSQSPSYTNPGMAAISGGAAGYQLGRDIYGR